jgi:putative toxin-antitoxin system antitoxin component (TIGR02293 family)
MKRSPQKTSLVAEPEALYGRASGKKSPATRKRPRADSLIERIRAGLPVSEFDTLRGLLGIPAEELSGYLNISRSTLIRRRRSGRLAPDESDRVIRFARLFGMTADVLGGHDEARAWLRQPARALGGAVPLAFAETEAGAREVENVLGRIEYGVYA